MKIQEQAETQMVDYATRMRKERDRARADLLKYGHHIDSCLMGPTCYCGWEELKRELERSRDVTERVDLDEIERR